MRPISNHFEKVLHAPLKNKMWSWGAAAEDGSIVFRCWNDEWVTRDGKQYMQVDWGSVCNGGIERRMHLHMVTHHKIPCYAVLAVVKDPTATPRKILTYKDTELLELGNELVTLTINDRPVQCLEIKGRKML